MIAKDSIYSEEFKIRDFFRGIQDAKPNYLFWRNIDNEIIRKRFENSIQDSVKQLRKVFIEFVETPDVKHKQILSQTCNDTNAMNDVLTSLHNEIVNGGNGTLNELLDGGVSH